METIQLNNIFKNYKRNGAIKNIVIHETCGTRSENAIATMLRLGTGVHFIIDFDGAVIQCNDPLQTVDPRK